MRKFFIPILLFKNARDGMKYLTIEIGTWVRLHKSKAPAVLK